MILEDGTLKLTDFGIAKDLDVTAADRGEQHHRHRRLHVARAVQGRPAPHLQVGPLLARRRLLRTHHRQEAVRRRERDGDVPAARQRQVPSAPAGSSSTCPSGWTRSSASCSRRSRTSARATRRWSARCSRRSRRRSRRSSPPASRPPRSRRGDLPPDQRITGRGPRRGPDAPWQEETQVEEEGQAEARPRAPGGRPARCCSPPSSAASSSLTRPALGRIALRPGRAADAVGQARAPRPGARGADRGVSGAIRRPRQRADEADAPLGRRLRRRRLREEARPPHPLARRTGRASRSSRGTIAEEAAFKAAVAEAEGDRAAATSSWQQA